MKLEPRPLCLQFQPFWQEIKSQNAKAKIKFLRVLMSNMKIGTPWVVLFQQSVMEKWK